MKETNNDHFIIEGSADGVSFQELSKIILKSGNSDTSLDYLFTLDLSTTFIAELMAIGLLVLLPFSKKRKHLALITITGLMMSTLSCKKVNDIDPNEQSLYVRILQVDKDGGKNYSKVVKALVKQ